MTDVEAHLKKFRKELHSGIAAMVLLALLERTGGEMYGYQIVSTLTERTGGSIEVSDGTLYPVLYRLERAELVSVRWDTPDRGVPRKYYALTNAGRTELAQLTHEWTRYARAMAELLGQEKGR